MWLNVAYNFVNQYSLNNIAKIDVTGLPSIDL
jgi:hypothetical protein